MLWSWCPFWRMLGFSKYGSQYPVTVTVTIIFVVSGVILVTTIPSNHLKLGIPCHLAFQPQHPVHLEKFQEQELIFQNGSNNFPVYRFSSKKLRKFPSVFSWNSPEACAVASRCWLRSTLYTWCRKLKSHLNKYLFFLSLEDSLSSKHELYTHLPSVPVIYEHKMSVYGGAWSKLYLWISRLCHYFQMSISAETGF